MFSLNDRNAEDHLIRPIEFTHAWVTNCTTHYMPLKNEINNQTVRNITNSAIENLKPTVMRKATRGREEGMCYLKKSERVDALLNKQS